MRPIDYDTSKIDYPDDWKEKAAELLRQLMEAPDAKARHDILTDKNNRIWSELKRQLRELSHGKCWYTESPQVGTDVDVDHFRPKGRVAERTKAATPHPGYWWLAYEPSNFRYSCIVANRRRHDVEAGRTGGKADHFPIYRESARASSPASDHRMEKPLLIDPCVAHEPDLITFKDDGEAMPRFDARHRYKHAKAKRSIKLYSINHSEFVAARLELRDRIERLKENARVFYSKLEAGDAAHEQAYASAIGELARLRRPSAPYSAFSAALIDAAAHEEYLFGLRSA